jgi:hypothetical protein
MEESDNSIDFDAMSEEELEAYINGEQVNEPEIENIESDPITGQPETELHTDNSTIEPVNEQKNQVDDDDLNDPQYSKYAGKTKKELAEMVLNGTRKISEQGNVIHEYKTRLEAIDRVKNQTANQKTDLSGYDQGDLETIKRVAYEQALEAVKHTENERIAMKEQEIQRNREENDNIFALSSSLVSGLFPKEVLDNIKSKMIEEVKQDADSTVNTSGWAKNRIKELISQYNQGNHTNTTTIKKKVVRNLNGGMVSGGGSPSGGSYNSEIEPDDPDEYRKWLKDTKGIVI